MIYFMTAVVAEFFSCSSGVLEWEPTLPEKDLQDMNLVTPWRARWNRYQKLRVVSSFIISISHP